MQSSISSSSYSTINKKLIFFVFSFFLIVDIISTGGHFDWSDGPEAFRVTESMALKHSAKLYQDTPSALIILGKPYYQQALATPPSYTYRPILLLSDGRASCL